MENKENVCGETTLTEGVAEASEKEASTVLGKFKDVSALERAYESLQAEFTRRSQRLRELERESENFKRERAAQSGAEKLRKTANAKREERKGFDAFIADMGSPSVTEKKPDEVSVDEDKPTENGVEAKVFFEREALGEKEDDVAIAKEKSAKEQTLGTAALALQESGAGEVTLSSVAGSKAQEPTEDLFELAVNNEAVRLRIIGEYLTSLGRSNAPLTAVGGGTLASPPLKAKTVGEAGNMALLYLRKPNT